MVSLLLSILILSAADSASIGPRWTSEQAAEWYREQGWLVGANFIPSTAVNQLEMWQAETYDTSTIDRELGFAEGAGMNVMRVFLHDLAWQADSAGFKSRVGRFLGIAAKHRIRILFVIFDDCWYPDAAIGKQPAPKPGVHNSGWVRSPNAATHNDPGRWGYLERYVKDIISTFGRDGRVFMWDLYNEPGNSGYNERSLPLLKEVFRWARAASPTQPLTSGLWYDHKELNAFQISNSDVITFHNYSDTTSLKQEILNLQKLGRPIVCTEYMARTRHSTFQTHLPIFKHYDVGAINWGLVSGKTNTIYEWDKPVPDGSEPMIWFHDVFRKNGNPYRPEEVKFIREITRNAE